MKTDHRDCTENKGACFLLHSCFLITWRRLEVLVQKRSMNVNYLRKVHLGGNFWLNTMLLSERDIQNLVLATVPKQRIVAYYYLGLSLHNLLTLTSSLKVIQGFSTLIEEYEYFCSGTAMQGMKLLMAKSSPCVYPNLNHVDGCDVDSIAKPNILKFQNSVVFEFLKTPHLAFELNYVDVLVALCEALSKVYEKLLAEDNFL